MAPLAIAVYRKPNACCKKKTQPFFAESEILSRPSQKCAQVSEEMCEEMCKDMRRYAKICEDMRRYAKIWKYMERYEKICEDTLSSHMLVIGLSKVSSNFLLYIGSF